MRPINRDQEKSMKTAVRKIYANFKMIIININKRKVLKLKELNLLIEANHHFHPIEEKILNQLQ